MQAATRLQQYLTVRHWTDAGLVGPDPGIRLNYRFGRFLKSYLGSHTWNDDYYYLQGQGYWVLANWRLFDATKEEHYRSTAVAASSMMLSRQRDDGAWDYPNFEWRGRVATVEGVWASLGLIETYRHVGDPSMRRGAERWHAFMLEHVGFRKTLHGHAVNYFANRERFAVVNNSACVLRFLAELAQITNDRSFLDPAPDMVTFVTAAQKPSGELPYAVNPDGTGPGRAHFQCYQYNAFQCLDLSRYRELADDPAVEPVLQGVVRYLQRGVANDGHAYYSCSNRHTAITYHAAALAAALLTVGSGVESTAHEQGRRALDYVLLRQRPDGSFPHSQGDYRILRDNRCYPRYLAMIAYHLTLASAAFSTAPAELASRHGT